MCVDPQQSQKNRQRHERQRRFHRLRRTFRRVEDGGAGVRPLLSRRRQRIDPRVVVVMGAAEDAYSTTNGIVRAALKERRRQDAEDFQHFAEEHPYAGLTAA